MLSYTEFHEGICFWILNCKLCKALFKKKTQNTHSKSKLIRPTKCTDKFTKTIVNSIETN